MLSKYRLWLQIGGLIALVLGGSAWLQAALPDPNIQAFLAGSTEIAYVERGPNGAMVEATYTLGLAQNGSHSRVGHRPRAPR